MDAPCKVSSIGDLGVQGKMSSLELPVTTPQVVSHQERFTHVVYAPIRRVGIVMGPEGATLDNIRRAYQVYAHVPREPRGTKKPRWVWQRTAPDPSRERIVPITISGNRTQAEAAVRVIEALIASVTCHRGPDGNNQINTWVSQDFCAELIGQRGENVRRLEKYYGVHVTFENSPSAIQTGRKDDSTIIPGPISFARVIIEGPKAAVIGAHDELSEVTSLLYEGPTRAETYSSSTDVSRKSVLNQFLCPRMQLAQL
ncbi:hypothetical protein FRC12_004501 [Ceratobasidium sp. 428]|nr:hypothetical protein FRC12_004501 [Ceratobasidium sp. 428]